MLKKRIAILGIATISLFSTVALATANHGANVSRNGLKATGYAWTYWDRGHATKIQIGIFMNGGKEC